MSSDEKKDTTNTEPPAKKKRVADRQIAKEDYDEDKEVGDNDDGTFRKADEATLQKRRIVKARRPAKVAGSAGESQPSSNPFANTVLVANKDVDASKTSKSSTKVFGSGASFSGFGSAAAKSDDKTSSGFGSTSGGFGSAAGGFKGFATAPKTSGGFGGFGSAAASGGGTTKNLFDTSNAPAFGFGAKKTTTDDAEEKDGAEAGSKSPNASPAKPALKLPDQVELTTGEEKEEKLFECRVKTHVMENTKEKGDKESATQSASVAAPSVPPSSSSFSTATAKPTASEPDAAAGASPNSKADAKGEATGVKKEWKELGVGPLKVLEGGPNKFRLVQRYQGKNPGDQPTKVILNVPFFKESVVSKPGDKYVHLTSFLPSEEGKGCEPTTFSFKMKEEAQVKKLYELLLSKQKEAKAFFKKKEDSSKEEETKAS